MSNICIFRGNDCFNNPILYLSYQKPRLLAIKSTNNKIRNPKHHRNEFLFFCDLFEDNIDHSFHMVFYLDQLDSGEYIALWSNLTILIHCMSIQSASF